MGHFQPTRLQGQKLASQMITEIKNGSRVRVRIERNGLHVRSYVATVTGWRKNGNLTLKTDDGKSRSVSAESCKLIKQ